MDRKKRDSRRSRSPGPRVLTGKGKGKGKDTPKAKQAQPIAEGKNHQTPGRTPPNAPIRGDNYANSTTSRKRQRSPGSGLQTGINNYLNFNNPPRSIGDILTEKFGALNPDRLFRNQRIEFPNRGSVWGPPPPPSNNPASSSGRNSSSCRNKTPTKSRNIRTPSKNMNGNVTPTSFDRGDELNTMQRFARRMSTLFAADADSADTAAAPYYGSNTQVRRPSNPFTWFDRWDMYRRECGTRFNFTPMPGSSTQAASPTSETTQKRRGQQRNRSASRGNSGNARGGRPATAASKILDIGDDEPYVLYDDEEDPFQEGDLSPKGSSSMQGGSSMQEGGLGLSNDYRSTAPMASLRHRMELFWINGSLFCNTVKAIFQNGSLFNVTNMKSILFLVIAVCFTIICFGDNTGIMGYEEYVQSLENEQSSSNAWFPSMANFLNESANDVSTIESMWTYIKNMWWYLCYVLNERVKADRDN